MKTIKMSSLSRSLSSFNDLLRDNKPFLVTKWREPLAVIVPLDLSATDKTTPRKADIPYELFPMYHH